MESALSLEPSKGLLLKKFFKRLFLVFHVIYEKPVGSYVIKIFTRSEQQQTNNDNEGKRKYNKTGFQNVPYDFLAQVFFDGRISVNMILNNLIEEKTDKPSILVTGIFSFIF